MIQFPEEFDSVFRYVEVVSQRARQIIMGAKPRAESQASKPTLQARDDVDAGRVDWRVLTQEELDAQRQALVEQFRAEMSAEDRAPEVEAAVNDVLPTSAPPAGAAVDDVERDDELVRLQQLLGLVGKPSAHAAVASDLEDDESDDEDDEKLDLDVTDVDDVDEVDEED